MIRKYGFKTYEEAVKEATALLWEARSGDSMETTEYKRIDKEGKPIPFLYIEDKHTGATAYLYSFSEEHGYNLTFLSEEEAKPENRTLPYRDVPKKAIAFLMALNTPIFKPTKEVTTNEALTPDGLYTIYSFFGIGKEEELPFTHLASVTDFSLDKAFEYWEDEYGKVEIGALLIRPYPQELTAKTGIAIKDPADYAKALSESMSVKLNEEQTQAAKESFSFYASEALLRYAIYEFFRTENYSHLKEILSNFSLFALPKNWEDDFTLYYGYRNLANKEQSTTEISVLAKYLSNYNANIVGSPIRLKEIAAHTGTPLAILSKANMIKHIWDF